MNLNDEQAYKKERLEQIKQRAQQFKEGKPNWARADQDFRRNAPDDIQWLIEEVERLRKLVTPSTASKEMLEALGEGLNEMLDKADLNELYKKSAPPE